MSSDARRVTINGRVVTQEEYDAWAAKMVRRHGGMDEILRSRKAPGGHQPYWGTGHISEAAGVPAAMAAEHADWIRSQGLPGVEVLPDGNIKASSPENYKRYLDARGIGDAGTAGSGEYRGQWRDQQHRRIMDQHDRKGELTESEQESIRERAAQIAKDPRITTIFEGVT